MRLTGLTSVLEPPEVCFLSLLRHLAYETVFNPCFLSGVTLKLCVSPQVVSVASLLPLECLLFSIFRIHPGFSRLAPVRWLESRKQRMQGKYWVNFRRFFTVGIAFHWGITFCGDQYNKWKLFPHDSNSETEACLWAYISPLAWMKHHNIEI